MFRVDLKQINAQIGLRATNLRASRCRKSIISVVIPKIARLHNVILPPQKGANSVEDKFIQSSLSLLRLDS